MLLVWLVGCGSSPLGTWLFFREVPEFVGDECATSVSHNFIGAYTPPELLQDLSWQSDSSSSVSEEVFFGRVEELGDGLVLIVGNDAYPGIEKGGGLFEFSWTGEDGDLVEQQHVTGYAFTADTLSTSTVRITGTFSKDGFLGNYDVETSTVASYQESDTWSAEAAAYVGTTGQIPASSYLLRLDSTGAEAAAYNDQSAYDCSAVECFLTVQDGCAWRYPLTGEATELTPDDAGWADDAGQPAGL